MLAVKDNQPTRPAAIRAALDRAAHPGTARPREQVTRDTGHGRFEERPVRGLPAQGPLPEAVRSAWPGLRTLVLGVRVVTCLATGKESEEVGYSLSSLRPGVRRLGRALRGHWRIEQGLHGGWDVVFREAARRW